MAQRGRFLKPFLAVLVGVVAIFFIQAFNTEGVVSTAKKIFGAQWHNGNRLLAKEFKRGHTEIKGLLGTKSPAFQDRYKQLAEAYADLVDAKASGSGVPLVINQQLAEVKNEAGILLGELFGSLDRVAKPQATSDIRPDDIVLDPIDRYMLTLEQSQAEQKRKLLEQLEKAQREQRVQVGQKLVEARQRHLTVQRETQILQMIFNDIRRGIDAIGARLEEISKEGGNIDNLGRRIESALQDVSLRRHDRGASGHIPPEFFSLNSEAMNTKASLGRSLGEMNRAFEALLGRVEEAEERARYIRSISDTPSRAIVEQYLQTIASFRIKLNAMEESLRELVSVLEKKQLACDALVGRLQAVLEEFYQRFASSICDGWMQLPSKTDSLIELVLSQVMGGAEEIKQELNAGIAMLLSGAIDWPLLGTTLQNTKARYLSWNSATGEGIVSLDGVVEEHQNLGSSAKALPEGYQAQLNSCQVGLQNALKRALDAQTILRQEKARLQQLMGHFESRYKEGVSAILAPVQQQGPLIGANQADGLVGFNRAGMNFLGHQSHLPDALSNSKEKAEGTQHSPRHPFMRPPPGGFTMSPYPGE